MIAQIGPGLYCRTKPRGLSLMDQYRKLQANCPHAQRDPRGTCYHCGLTADRLARLESLRLLASERETDAQAAATHTVDEGPGWIGEEGL
jgi:hypothetical protein